MKKTLSLLLVVIFAISCAPRIRTIVEYQKKENNLIKTRLAEFDKKGNKTLERGFGNEIRNWIERFEYDKGNRVKTIRCDYYEKEDICVLRSFIVLEYKPKTNILETITIYEADSLVRAINEYYKTKELEIVKTYSWEIFPTDNPNKEDAIMQMTDSIFYDKKGRVSKIIHYNKDFKEPDIKKYTYHKDGYTIESYVVGDEKNTYKRNIVDDKLKKKHKVDFDFDDTTKYKYEIKYY